MPTTDFKSKFVSDEKEDTGAGWITTFADSMTLLMTFFIALFAMSSIDAVKYEQMVEAMSNNPKETGRGFSEDYGKQKTLSETRDALEKIAESIRGASVTSTPEGVKFELPNEVLFRVGSNALEGQVLTILDEILPEIELSSHPVAVVGHTDTDPIPGNSVWASNFDLSAARATSVVDYFVSKGVRPVIKNDVGKFPRFQVRGFGEYFPAEEGDTETAKAKNRRIEFIWLKNVPR